MPDTAAQHHDDVQNACHLIADLIAEGITPRVTPLAATLEMSVRSLQRAFDERDPPMKIRKAIRDARLERAATKLTAASNHQSVEQIAASVGYDYATSFCKAFKDRFGETPERYRRAQRRSQRRAEQAADLMRELQDATDAMTPAACAERKRARLKRAARVHTYKQLSRQPERSTA